jgi:uncharacterized protein (DUF2345 family)
MPMLLDIKAATHSYSTGGAKAGKLPKLPKGTFGAIAALGALDDGQGGSGTQNVPALGNKAAPKAKDKAGAEVGAQNQYRARFQLSEEETGQPLAKYAYKIKRASGDMISGFTDQEGWTLPAVSEISEPVELEVAQKEPVQAEPLYLAGGDLYMLELEYLNEQNQE